MTAREHFLECVESLLGMPVLWAQKGPDSYDCSGLVTACLCKVGAPDLRHTHNAQALHDITRPLGTEERPLYGDVAFYGHGRTAIEHVAVVDGFGGVISADGATHRILNLKDALEQGCRVRRHIAIDFRHDLPFHAVHRNLLLDALDRVES